MALEYGRRAQPYSCNPAGVTHCWESTGLLRVWDRGTQVEAAGKAAALFPNIDPADVRNVSGTVTLGCRVRLSREYAPPGLVSSVASQGVRKRFW